MFNLLCWTSHLGRSESRILSFLASHYCRLSLRYPIIKEESLFSGVVTKPEVLRESVIVDTSHGTYDSFPTWLSGKTGSSVGVGSIKTETTINTVFIGILDLSWRSSKRSCFRFLYVNTEPLIGFNRRPSTSFPDFFTLQNLLQEVRNS